MPRRTDVEEDWEDDEKEFDSSERNDDETVPCPYCKRPIYEGAERCPHCEKYISEEDAPRVKPVWIVIGVALGLLIVLMWILSGW